MIERFPKTLSSWWLRLLLAALFLFGSEVLLWTNPLGHAPSDWLLAVPGYLALAALVLDLAARYRIRDVYDAMTLLAVYGLLNGLLLNPQIAFAEIPDTLVNRVLGGYTLTGLEMFGLLLALTGGHIGRYRRLLLAASLWLGFYWGTWVRWSPVYTELSSAIVPVETMLLVGGVGLLIIAALWVIAARRTAALTPADLRLSALEWSLALAALLALFIVRAAQDTLAGNGLVVSLLLIAGCMATLWFRRQERGRTLLDAHLPPTPLAWAWSGVAVVIYGAAALVAYHLPLVNLFGINQFSLMTLGFALVGLGWLPLIATVLGVRALDRHSRTGKL